MSNFLNTTAHTFSQNLPIQQVEIRVQSHIVTVKERLAEGERDEPCDIDTNITTYLILHRIVGLTFDLVHIPFHSRVNEHLLILRAMQVASVSWILLRIFILKQNLY